MLGRTHVAEVVSTLADAFGAYAVLRFVLGSDPDPHRLRTLVRMFVMARVYREEPLLGIRRGSELASAALVSFPDGPAAPEAFRQLRAKVWRDLGSEAEARYEAFGAATRAFSIDEPHVHLNMVGVRRRYRGQGLGRRLIEAVQRISRERPGSRGVTLTTEDPANLAFYEKLGFERLGTVRVGPDLESWGFFRRDSATGGPTR